MRATAPAFGVALTPRVDPADFCDCGEALNRAGECFRCDRCHCANRDKGTGYMECQIHSAPLRTGDVMGALKTAMCRCTSDEFARPACAVHGKAV